MSTFLTSNEAKWRLARTIVQGILSVIITELPELLGLFHIPPQYIPLLVPLIMAVLSPIMASIGDTLEMQSLKGFDDEADENIDIGE